jgi:hypothetical protein
VRPNLPVPALVPVGLIKAKKTTVQQEASNAPAGRPALSADAPEAPKGKKKSSATVAAAHDETKIESQGSRSKKPFTTGTTKDTGNKPLGAVQVLDSDLALNNVSVNARRRKEQSSRHRPANIGSGHPAGVSRTDQALRPPPAASPTDLGAAATAFVHSSRPTVEALLAHVIDVPQNKPDILAAGLDVIARTMTVTTLWQALGRHPTAVEVQLAAGLAAQSFVVETPSPILNTMLGQQAQERAAQFETTFQRAVASVKASRGEIQVLPLAIPLGAAVSSLGHNGNGQASVTAPTKKKRARQIDPDEASGSQAPKRVKPSHVSEAAAKGKMKAQDEASHSQ